MAAVTICRDFRAQEEEICHYFHLSPFYLPWSNEADAMILVFFLIFSFKLALSLSLFNLTERFFSSSLLSAIIGVICLSEFIDVSPACLDSY